MCETEIHNVVGENRNLTSLWRAWNIIQFAYRKFKTPWKSVDF